MRARISAAERSLFTAEPELRHHVRSFHHGQMDCTLLLVSPAGENLAYLDYSVYDAQPQIQMISARRRRRGYATRLLAELQARHPDQEIDWGATTAQGAALRAALPTREVPTPEAPLFARLERISARLARMEAKIAHLQAQGADARREITAYYCLERHVSDLAWRLEDARRTLKILDLPAAPVQASTPPRADVATGVYATLGIDQSSLRTHTACRGSGRS